MPAVDVSTCSPSCLGDVPSRTNVASLTGLPSILVVVGHPSSPANPDTFPASALTTRDRVADERKRSAMENGDPSVD
jgi:hypothetical protein